MKNGRLLVIELNEFNKDLLRDAADQLGLKNIGKLFSLRRVQLSTSDTYDSDLLEPWVQWVNVHTGKASNEHGVRHLGDVPGRGFPQIWEELSRRGITSGAWGVLNGDRGNAKNCLFFLPDPWTFCEVAHPAELNSLLDFPRYVATHRTSLKMGITIKTFLRFARKLFSRPVFWGAIKKLPIAALTVLRNPRQEYAGFCFVEYLSSLLFLEYWKKKAPDAGFIFLNMLAHVQHYHWRGLDYKNNSKLQYCLKFVDSFLGKAYQALGPDDRIMVLNGLSQKNTNNETPWIGYRAYDFEKFLCLFDIEFEKVESLMSYDAHIFFENEASCLRAQEILKQAKIGDQSLLLVESYPEEPKKLFFRPQFYDPVESGTTFTINGKEFEFLKIFKPLGVRTGKHIPEGCVFTDLDTETTIPNHRVFNVIMDHFSENASELRPEKLDPGIENRL